MTADPMAQATAPLLHRFLGIGLILVAVSLIVVRLSGAVSLEQLPDVIPYAFSGLTVVLLGLALIIFKPRVPERRPGQSVAQYWSTPEVAARVFPVWFFMEGAGVISAVGYFLSGSPVPAVTLALAVLAFWFTGPNVFAKE